MINKNIIFLIFNIILLSNLVNAEIYYSYDIELNYDRENISLISISIESSFVEPLINKGAISIEKEEYVAKIFSHDGSFLNTIFFDIPEEVITYSSLDPKTGKTLRGGIFNLDQINFTLHIPYYEEAKKILVYNENNYLVLSIDVSMFSKEYSETGLVIGDQDIEEEESQRTVKDEKQGKTITDYWWILLIILIVLILILFYSLKKKK